MMTERVKIDYGIDLGTTNSSICRMEHGEPTLLRTDTLREVMPSCVSFTRRQGTKVGDSAYNDMKQDKRRATHGWRPGASNTYQEFKRTMGTDTRYHSDNMQRDYSSEELSAMVLQTLRSFVGDETPASAVITVPAKFTVNQKTATLEAARLAGFAHCQLLQEPIAAALAYGLSPQSEQNGRWLVFDFGGGTFDAALLEVEDGIIAVRDTEGDNYLGGKNLDYAIVDRIIMPYVGSHYAIGGILADPQKQQQLRDALKTYAEEVKIQLSHKEAEDILSNLGDLGNDDDGEEIELDMTITRQEAYDVMRPLLQKAVDICLALLARNGIDRSRLDRIILVGGPTRLPLVREMLSQQVGAVADSAVDPMTAVAVGAAIYASTQDVPAGAQPDGAEADALQLEVGYEGTTVELTDWISLKTPPGVRATIELARADGAWSSGMVEVDERGRVVTVQLLARRPNTFVIKATDDKGQPLRCHPQEFVILQGTKAAGAVLPYHIGISVWNERKEDGVFLPFAGLEKNKPLPAVGMVCNRHTSAQLRPGIDTDVMNIPVYQADDYQKNFRAYLYEWVADVTVTGDEVSQLVPAGSPVEVTLKVDQSEQMTMEVYFPSIDFTVSKPLPTNKQQSVEEAARRITTDIASAYNTLYVFARNGIDVAAMRRQLAAIEEENRNSSEKKAVLQHLKEVLRRIEALEGDSEQERVMRELKDALEMLKANQERYGNDVTQMKVTQLAMQAEQVLAMGDMRFAKTMTDAIKHQNKEFLILRNYISWVHHFDYNFNTYKWRNEEKARKACDKALAIVDDHPTIARLDPLLDILFEQRIVEKADTTSGGSAQTSSNSTPEPTKESPCNGLLI